MSPPKKSAVPKAPPQPKSKGKCPEFVTVYRHYLTGKTMAAKDYGYKAWHFGKR